MVTRHYCGLSVRPKWGRGLTVSVVLVGLTRNWLFPGTRCNKWMTTRQLNRLFHEAADAAGIEKTVTLHALRHSFYAIMRLGLPKL